MLKLFKSGFRLYKCMLIVFFWLLQTYSFGQFAPSHESNLPNYIPDGQLIITINLTGANASDTNMRIQFTGIPESWVPGTETVSPNPFVKGFNQSLNVYEIAYNRLLGAFADSGDSITLMVDVPSGFEDVVALSMGIFRGTSSSGPFTPSTTNPVEINPPPPPDFSNPSPADSFLTQQDPLAIGNSVTAGQNITFSVDVTATSGQTLTGSSFFVATSLFDEASSQWTTNDSDSSNWPSNDGNSSEISFEDTSPKSGLGDNDFTWTQLAADANGTRTFNWTVSPSIVNKSTPQEDRVFVVGIKADQDNGAQGNQFWAVRVNPINQNPEFVASSEVPASQTMVSEDAQTTFMITATDADNVDILDVTWHVDGGNALETDTIDQPVDGISVQVSFDHTFDFNTVQHPSRGNTVQVMARVTDRDGGGPTEFIWNVTVNDVNRPPVDGTGSAAITPTTNILTTTDLTCTVTNPNDPDGDQNFQYTYVWEDDQDTELRNSGPVSSMTDILPAADDRKNRMIHCEVTIVDVPYGDTETGNQAVMVASAEAAVDNSSPVANGIKRDGSGDTIVEITLLRDDTDPQNGILNFTVDASDPDSGESLTVSIPNTSLATITPNTGDISQTFQYEANDKGNDFPTPDTLSITVSDSDATNPLSAQVQISINYIADRPPVLENLIPENATPLSQTETDSVQFEITAFDPGNIDAQIRNSVATLEWLIDDVVQGNDSVTTPDPNTPNSFTYAIGDIVLHEHILNGEEITSVNRPDVSATVKARATDTAGTQVEEEWIVNVTDKNTNPSLDGVTIDSDTPTETDTDVTFVVRISGSAIDPDATTTQGMTDREFLQYTYSWTRASNGQEVQKSIKNYSVSNDGVLEDSFTTTEKTEAFNVVVTVTDGIVDPSEQPTLNTTVSLSPAWYPTFALTEITNPDTSQAFEWYNFRILDAANSEVTIFETNINGTSIDGAVYFSVNFGGLLPGSYNRVHRGWNPADNTFGVTEESVPLQVSDYGFPGLPTFEPSDIVERDDGLYDLAFRVPNAQGFEVIIQNSDETETRIRKLIPPDENGRIPLNSVNQLVVELGSTVPSVLGFNPLNAESGMSQTPEPFRNNPATEIQENTIDFDNNAKPTGLLPATGGPDTVFTGDAVSFALSWNGVPGASNYLVFLTSNEIGTVINRELVGNITQIPIRITSTSNGITFNFGEDQEILPPKSFQNVSLAEIVISFSWSVLALRDQVNGQWADTQTFDVFQSLSAPVIQSVSITDPVPPNPNTIFAILKQGSAFPGSVFVQRFRSGVEDGLRDSPTISVNEMDNSDTDSNGSPAIRIETSFDFQSGDFITIGVRLGVDSGIFSIKAFELP